MAHEARQYAQRNRQGSDWFSHDGKSPPAPAAVKPAAVEPVPAIREMAADENNIDKSTIADAAPAPAAPVSARAQMIRPKCDSNEWFVSRCLRRVQEYLVYRVVRLDLLSDRFPDWIS